MTPEQNGSTQDGGTFSGSPYLHDFAARLIPIGNPKPISKTSIERFIDRSFGSATESPAKDAVLAALEYYAQLPEVYGSLFPEETINTAADEADSNATVSLAAKFVEGLPDQPVILSVLDEGIPFLHERTKRADNSSRFVSVWMQNARPMDAAAAGDPPFGKCLHNAQIQNLIDGVDAEETAYRQCGAIDLSIRSPQRLTERSTHGAAVLGLAAGEKTDKHLLMGVCFPPNAVRDTSGSLLPFFMLMGICYCLERARALSDKLRRDHPKRFGDVRIPVIFSLSYGVLAGPKDGSGVLESVMEHLSQMPSGEFEGVGDIKFVLPMGNGRQSQTAATLGGELDRSASFRLIPDDRTPSYVEIWNNRSLTEKPASQMSFVRLTPPQSKEGKTIPLIEFGSHQAIEFGCGTRVRVYSSLRQNSAGYRQTLLLSFDPTSGPKYSHLARAGDWQIELLPETEECVQIYVQRDEGIGGLSSGGRQSRMHHPAYLRRDQQGRWLENNPEGSNCPVTRSGTVSAFANAPSIIRVSGSIERTRDLASYSAKGVEGTQRPPDGDVTKYSDQSRNISGLNVRGVRSCSATRLSGTSLAVPQVALDLAKQYSP